jgi:hypothetical protein
MANGKIGVTTENIFPVIKKFLYSDHEIFLRELVANAVDATQKMKAVASRGEFNGELGDLTIRVAVDDKENTLTITDRGIGMTAEEVAAMETAPNFMNYQMSTDEALLNAGCTIQITAIKAVVAESVTNAR